jgi:hypothetical protein
LALVYLSSLRSSMHTCTHTNLYRLSLPLAVLASCAFGKSLCARGKLIPELYLLGAQKSGTTTLAADLVNTGVRSAAAHGKEFHFFDNWLTKDVQKAKTNWLGRLPRCPRKDGTTRPHRMIMADFTARNLKMVSSPMAGAPKMDLPSMLHSFYGPAMSQQLTFLVMLREPVSRMHSAWYDSKTKRICWPGACGASFQEDLFAATKEARQTPPKYNDWWWRSLYALQLKEYFSRFLRYQFIVIPYKLYVNRKSSAICDMLSAHLAFPVKCPPTKVHLNAHDHQDLAQDVPDTLLHDCYDLMAAENRRLAEELAVGQPSGAILADFSGNSSSESQILSWLQAGW